MKSKRTGFLILFWLSLTFSIQAQENILSPRKKLIELGWDIPSTQFLKKNWEEMEATTPFDGVIYHLNPPGKISSQAIWDARPWNKDDYAVCIDDLNSCHFKQFTDNFIRINFSPANIQWDDDAAWKIIMEKVSICAWVSQASGNKGVAPDFESYGETLFQYKTDSGLSWEESKALAFRRGSEFVQAIASYQPNAVVLCLWMNSINSAAGRSSNPDSILSASSYGLLPSFINGMLSAAPDEMILIDGCENGYYYNSQEEYQRAALNMLLWTGSAMKLVDPELKQKYRRQVRAGFGFYLDMYSNPEGNIYYRGPKEGGTRMDRLSDNLSFAVNASDEYVWIYGEKHRWWGVSEDAPESLNWEVALPGLNDIIWQIKNPKLAAQKIFERMQKENPGVNLLQNGHFKQGNEGELPQNWGSWQIENKPAGNLHWSQDHEGCALAQKVSNGCFIQSLDVKENERYYFRVKVKTNRLSSVSVRLRWQTADSKWIHEDLDPIFVVDSKTASVNDFNIIEGLAVVPQGVGRIVVLLSASGQSENDFVLFDNAELYRIDSF
ncbi:MAG: hypothetical protein Q4C95_11625 [Planctomycetia bacterium]|nr:hypothetical protein [Planctomycetia bacterium]